MLEHGLTKEAFSNQFEILDIGTRTIVLSIIIWKAQGVPQ